ncbi:MAG: hypothetical protein QG599_335 [Pseudomonadota bacterium]|nr:hypothetical protein [Pseudomonadota bacterium]
MMFSAPELLNSGHRISDFSCGESALDDWLKRRALANQQVGASRTFVIQVEGRVVGFYALAAGAVNSEQAPGRIRRNMPNPIPLMVLGRLAVDRVWQQHGLGPVLLGDALRRTLRVAKEAGVRALMVQAMSEVVKTFYLKFGFVESPQDPLLLFLRLPPSDGHDGL